MGRSLYFFLHWLKAHFFPYPPDALMIALILGAVKKSWRFALITSIASVLGGMIGYRDRFRALGTGSTLLLQVHSRIFRRQLPESPCALSGDGILVRLRGRILPHPLQDLHHRLRCVST